MDHDRPSIRSFRPRSRDLYLTSADVSTIARQGHWIGAGTGESRRFMDANFPGWTWFEIVHALRDAGVFHKPEPHGGYLDRALIGVLITSDGSVTPDDGSLVHPLKTARLESMS